MEKLPKVFVNPINDNINNSQYKSIVDDNKVNLDNILSKDKYSFNHVYLITLKNNKQIKSSIIKIMNNKILTIDNDLINIDNILSIIEIKK